MNLCTDSWFIYWKADRVQKKIQNLSPIARPSLKLCMPSPMMTIQAMLAIPASFISWSEWQFPPWEWPWPCECPWLWCFALRPFSLVGDWRSCRGFAGASVIFLVGESGVWSSVSCVSLWPLSQETAVLSGSGGGKTHYSDRHGNKVLQRLSASYLRWEALGAATLHLSDDLTCDLTTSGLSCPPRSPSSCPVSRDIILHSSPRNLFHVWINRNQTRGWQRKATALDNYLCSPSSIVCRTRLSYPMVFVVLEHADTVFNDEEEVDAGQRC